MELMVLSILFWRKACQGKRQHSSLFFHSTSSPKGLYNLIQSPYYSPSHSYPNSLHHGSHSHNYAIFISRYPWLEFLDLFCHLPPDNIKALHQMMLTYQTLPIQETGIHTLGNLGVHPDFLDFTLFSISDVPKTFT